jgi:hypothetical protein
MVTGDVNKAGRGSNRTFVRRSLEAIARDVGADFVMGKNGNPHKALNLIAYSGRIEAPIKFHVFGNYAYAYPHNDESRPMNVGEIHLSRQAVELRKLNGAKSGLPEGVWKLKASPEAQATAARLQLKRQKDAAKKRAKRIKR